MKNVIVISLTLICLNLSGALFAQSYTSTIQNQTVNGTNFSFDIYMQRTDATEIYLGQSEFSVIFNDGNFTFPTVSYVAGPDMGFYTVSVAIPSVNTNIVKFSVGALFFNNQSEFNARVCTPLTTAPGTLIATVTISGISNAPGFAGIQWRTTFPHDSKVNSYSNVTPWSLTEITSNGTYTDPVNAPLPVELSSFTAEANDYKVILNWKTATEINNFGFDIERSIKLGESEEPLWVTIGFIEGNGNSNSPKSYKFTDNKPVSGSKFVYRLKQIDYDGTYEYSGQVEVELIPGEYKLYQNYPNPFNPTTTIKYALPFESKVRIVLYNSLGELVTELVDELQSAGYKQVVWNASNVASGVYIYTIEAVPTTGAKPFSSIKKMVLLK